MTLEELQKLPFTMMSHVNTEHYHEAMYANKETGILMFRRTKYKDGFPTGKTKTYYIYKGEAYKTAQALLNAIQLEELLQLVDKIDAEKIKESKDNFPNGFMYPL